MNAYGSGTETRMVYTRRMLVGCEPLVAGPKSSTKACVVAAGFVSIQVPIGAFVSAKVCQSHCRPVKLSANKTV